MYNKRPRVEVNYNMNFEQNIPWFVGEPRLQEVLETQVKFNEAYSIVILGFITPDRLQNRVYQYDYEGRIKTSALGSPYGRYATQLDFEEKDGGIIN